MTPFQCAQRCGLLLIGTSVAFGQSEIEPNDTKVQATVIANFPSGSWIYGQSTSASGPGLDYFRITTAAAPVGIYRHELTLSSSGSQGYTGTLRGLNQSGGVIGTFDTAVQTSSAGTSPQYLTSWYGFGRSEALYYRVTGTSQTTGQYYAVLQTSQIWPQFVGSFAAGAITIDSSNFGHTTNTDLWLYDSNYNAISGAGNDDIAAGQLQSRLTRTLAVGTYYVAIARSNLANSLASPTDDANLSGAVLDFPNAVAGSSSSVSIDLSFQISDGWTTLQAYPYTSLPYEVAWYEFQVVPPPPPANDACSAAVLVGVPSTTSGTTVSATVDAGLPVCNGPGVADWGGNNSNVAGSVWYRVTGNGQTIYAETLTASYDTKLTVYSGSCGAWSCVTVNDDIAPTYRSKVAWKSVVGQTYRVMVHGYASSSTGTFVLNLTSSPTPSNDECAQATAIAGISGSINGTNVGATGAPSTQTSVQVTSCAHPGTLWDTWFAWTPPCTGTATFSTCGAFDSVVSLHSTCPTLSASSHLGCNDDGPAGCVPGSSFSAPVVAGTSYRIRVATDGDHAIDPGGGGTYALTWSVAGVDSDGDGVPDCVDGCPSDPQKSSPGLCGCGVPESFGCAPATYAHRIIEQSPPSDPCKECSPSPISSNVALATGAVVLSETDLEVPSRGFPFRWTRTYHSRADFDGRLGHSWDLAYDRSIALTPGGDASVVDGNGREDLFTNAGGGSFTPPDSIYSTLFHNGDNTWTQREPDGTTHEFDASGWLIAIRDRAGNALTLTRNGFHQITQIVDTQGRLYTVQYAGSGANARIASLTDFAGRQIVYTIDSNGDLVAVRSPVVVGTPTNNNFPQGKTKLYVYSSGMGDSRLDHNLLRVIEPAYNVGNDPQQSKASRSFTYHATTDPLYIEFDRVVEQRTGHDQGGPPSNPNVVVGGTTTYTLVDSAIDPNWPATAARRCTELDGNGNVRLVYSDADFRTIQIIDRTNRNVRPGEGDYKTEYAYDAEGRIASRTDPRGNSVLYVYDSANPQRRSQGNLLEQRHATNGVSFIGSTTIERYTYEPVFNQLRTVTDPRAFPSGTVPLDGNGHLALSDPLVVRFTTTRTFDYQETTGVQALFGVPVSERIPEGLGNLNGAADFSEGNVVRVQLPTIQTAGPNFGQTSVETRSWNAQGQMLASTEATGSVTAYEYFPSNGVPNDPSDREGCLRAITRDAGAGHLQLRTEFTRDVVGNATSTIDPKGNATQVTFNSLDQVVRERSRAVSGSLRYQTDYVFDANDNLVRIERDNLDENGAARPHAEIVDAFEYDILRNLVVQSLDRTRDDGSLAGVARTEYVYDANRNRIAERTPEAVNGNQPYNVSTSLYDERDLLYKLVRADNDVDPSNAPPGNAAVLTLNYDANRNLIESIDKLRNAVSPNAPVTQFPGTSAGDVTRYAYDGFDRRTQITDGEGNRTEVQYDAASNPTRTTRTGPAVAGGGLVLLRQVDTTYDERSRPVYRDQPFFVAATGAPLGDGHATSVRSYDAEGKLTAETDDNFNTSTHTWDLADRLVRTTDALGNQIELTYDVNSNVVTRVQRDTSTTLGSAPETFTTTYTYDGLDRRIKVVDPAGGVCESSFDSRDNVVKTSDANRSVHPGGPGNTTRYEYDGLDRLVRTQHDMSVNGLGGGVPSPTGPVVTLQWWDDNSRRLLEQDGNGNATSYVYDALDRMLRRDRCDGGSWFFTYDDDGHRIVAIDPNQSATATTYDGVDRSLQHGITRGPGVAGTTYQHFAYDGLDRLVAFDGDDGIVGSPWVFARKYDSLGNPVEEASSLGSLLSEFDGASNRIYVERPSGRAYDYVYDALDRLVRTAEAALPPVVEFHFKGADAREERRDLGNGARHELTYDALPRLIRKRVLAPGGATQLDFQYGHDRMSRPLFERRAHESNLGQVYQYDSLDRVVRTAQSVSLGGVSPGQLIDPGAFSSAHEQSYQYDANSNRVLEIDQELGVHSQLEYEVDCTDAYTRIGGDYEPWGATSVLPRTRDDNGNTTADEQRRYEYDALDRLVRVRDRATGSTQVEYSYDALDRLVRRRAYAPDIVTLFVYDGEQLVEEYDGAALLEREYVWGLSEGDLVQERTPTATWYAHGDGRNDVVALAGASGAIVERYDYDAFGRATVVLDGGTGNCVRFEGEWADPRSNVLVSAGSAYDAGTGRALQEPGGARAVLACVGPGPFPTWGPMPRVRMPTLRDVDPQRWAQQEIQKLYDEMRRAAEGGGCVMPDWKRLEWLEGLANGTSLCPPTTPAPSTELLPLEPFGGPPGGKNIRPSLPGAMQSIHVESVVELPGQYWGFDFGADGAHVPWSWVMPQDPPPTCPPPPTYAYDALDRLVVTHVMVQDPPPAPPAVKEPKWPQDQETRERMVRDFIKKVRDNLPGDSTGGRVIQALREMLKDGEVTDTEMNIAQEMMNGLF